MPRNKLHIIHVRQKQKTFTGPRLVRNVVGKRVDKKKVRHAFVDNNGRVDTQKCMTADQAERQLKKFNMNNVEKAIFYDNEGAAHVIYDRNQESNSSPVSTVPTDNPENYEGE